MSYRNDVIATLPCPVCGLTIEDARLQACIDKDTAMRDLRIGDRTDWGLPWLRPAGGVLANTGYGTEKCPSCGSDYFALIVVRADVVEEVLPHPIMTGWERSPPVESLCSPEAYDRQTFLSFGIERLIEAVNGRLSGVLLYAQGDLIPGTSPQAATGGCRSQLRLDAGNCVSRPSDLPRIHLVFSRVERFPGMFFIRCARDEDSVSQGLRDAFELLAGEQILPRGGVQGLSLEEIRSGMELDFRGDPRWLVHRRTVGVWREGQKWQACLHLPEDNEGRHPAPHELISGDRVNDLYPRIADFLAEG